MTKEAFLMALEEWRARNGDRRHAYLAAIPDHVADSMALEGDIVDRRFLAAHLPTA